MIQDMHIIIITKTMFMVLYARVHPVYLMNVEWCQAAAVAKPSQTT